MGHTIVFASVRPAHEILEATDFKDESYSVKLREAIDSGGLPPSYDDNPVVLSNPDEMVAPFGVYMDSLPYSLVDSVLGVWLVNLVTGARHLMLMVRKKCVCDCSCRGWCTWFVVLMWLRWMMEALAEGVHPSRRHDGGSFSESFHDEHRKDAAGRKLRFKVAILKLRGDWQEFAERLGFPTWQSGIRPCFCCNAFGIEMYKPVGVTLSNLPWSLNQDADYEAACDRCEIWVVLSNPLEHSTILSALHYDKRKAGSKGRSLLTDIPSFGLKQYDRLEPNATLMDVGKYENISSFPCRVLFWRRSRETLCTRRSPLFNPRIGITPGRIIAICALHTLLLGPMLSWGKVALWLLLLSGVWGRLEASSEARLKIAILNTRTALMHWYGQEQRAGRIHTRIDYISTKMIGTITKPILKLKAMEGYGFSQFLVHCLGTYNVDGGKEILLAGQLLVRLVETMKTAPARLTLEMRVELLSLWKQNISIISDLGIYTPKHHLVFHMIIRSDLHGNPWLDATFIDESLNKELKQCCRLSHQVTFEWSVLVKVEEVLKRLFLKRRVQ